MARDRIIKLKSHVAQFDLDALQKCEQEDFKIGVVRVLSAIMDYIDQDNERWEKMYQDLGRLINTIGNMVPRNSTGEK